MTWLFEDSGRTIGVRHYNEHMEFLVGSPLDLKSALHYLKAHPDVIGRKIVVKRHANDSEIVQPENEDHVEIYDPHPEPPYNIIVLHDDMKSPMEDIVKLFALLVKDKQEAFGKVIPRETLVKKSVYGLEWQAILSEFYTSERALSMTSLRSNKDGTYSAMFLFAEQDTPAWKQYSSILEALPDADLERLITL